MGFMSRITDVASSLADKVDAAMAVAKIATRGELAKRCGIKESTLSESLNAASEHIRLFTLLRLAKELRTSVDSLIEGIDPDYDATRAAAPLQEQVWELWRLAVQKDQALTVWKVLILAAGRPDEPMPDLSPLLQSPSHSAVG